jgi:O-antigen/teichoic acid export membrane protein
MVWNLAGEAAPGISALLAVPFILHRLGAERFGIFTFAWAVAGSAGIFDLGLGRALTKLIADRIATGRGGEISALFWTAMGLLSMVGIALGAALLGFAPIIARNILHLDGVVAAEATATFRILAVSVPFIMIFTAVRGALAAFQRFDLLNWIRIPMGALVFLAPLPILYMRPSLVAAVWVILAVRAGGCVALAVAGLRAIPSLRNLQMKRGFAEQLLSFGGWVMVSNAANPILVYADRFIIGSMLTMAAVAWYATPLEVVARLAIIPAAVTSVLFPAMAQDLVGRPLRARRLLLRGVQTIFAAVFPATLILIAFAREGLTAWLGASFAAHCTIILQSFAIGTMVLSTCWMPFYLIQAANRPDITAKIHAAEVPLFLVVMAVATHIWGLTGAAIARGTMFALDGITMLIAARILMPQIDAAFRSACVMIAGGVCACVAALWFPDGLAIKGVLVVSVAALCALFGWRFAISDDERMKLRGLMPGLSG